MLFRSPVFYINKDAYQKAGLDPNSAPKTWSEFAAVAGKLKASGQACVYTSGWPSWVHVENFSAWHNLPIGTLENGIADRREFYNDSVNLNNIRVEQVPDVFVARLFNFGERDLLRFSDAETADVDVKALFE